MERETDPEKKKGKKPASAERPKRLDETDTRLLKKTVPRKAKSPKPPQT